MADFLRYIASDENTFPTAVNPSSLVYTHTITPLDDDTFRYVLTSDTLPTQVAFQNKTSLLKLEYLDTTNINTFFNFCYGCSNLVEVNTEGWNTSKVVSMVNMFTNCTNLTTVDVSNFDTSNVNSMLYMFGNCTNLTTIDVSKWNTSKVTNTGNMFQNCKLLASLDVSNWNTSNVNTMSYMFSGCSILESLDVGDWNTSKVNTMSAMFQNCSKLTSLDLSKWNTEKVTNMSNMFATCSSLNPLDVSKWVTSKVTDMTSMFSNCSNLTTLDLSNWNVSNVTNMSYLLFGCSNLTTLDVSGWNTSKVTNMYALFYNCIKLTYLDLSNWDVSNVSDTRNVFVNVKNADLGLLDCSRETVNTIASLNANNTGINIWVYAEDLTQYDQYANVTYHTHPRGNATSVDLYLNRPLQSGDRIESIYGKIFHVYVEGNNEVFEEIAEGELLIDSFPGGIIDFNSEVNVPRVDFKALEIPLTYIPDEPTIFQYIDGEGVQQAHNLSEVTNPLKCNDIGYTISKVQLVNSDSPFGYFKGLCSTGQNLRITLKFICTEDDSYTTRTFVLTSPLLQGDKLFSNANGIFVQHNSGIRPYQEGDLGVSKVEGVYITDLVNTVYTLEEPYYEKISEPIKFNKPYNLIDYNIMVGE